MQINKPPSVQRADPILSQVMAQVLRKARRLRSRLSRAPVSEEHEWFRNLLHGILNCALLDYKSVETGTRKSIYLAAWGGRNLLELRVITAYVLTSNKRANDFKSELLIDAKEFYEALAQGTMASHASLLSMISEAAGQEEGPAREILEEVGRREAERGPQTEAVDAEAAAYAQIMIEFGIDAKDRPKRVSDIARMVRQKADFGPMFKVYSKIMHRTALSIASSTVPGSLDEAASLLFLRGAWDFTSIYYPIHRHIEETGIRPPET